MALELNPETAALLGTDFAEDVQRFVVPIFRGADREAESVGSALLLRAGASIFLVTAAHVMDDLASGIRHYFYTGPRTTRELSGNAAVSKLPPSGNRDDDVIDVGVLLLEGEGLPPYPDVGREALSVTRLSPWATPRAGKKYAFLGYPSTKGKVDPSIKEIRSASYAYLGGSVEPAKYLELGLSEGSHIVLPFSDRSTHALDGSRMNFPKPQGMSGSPLWELRKPEDGGRCVVGIMIERRKQEGVFVAVDIGYALQFIRDHFRDALGVPIQEPGT